MVVPSRPIDQCKVLHCALREYVAYQRPIYSYTILLYGARPVPDRLSIHAAIIICLVWILYSSLVNPSQPFYAFVFNSFTIVI